jgi:hypothetical protein
MYCPAGGRAGAPSIMHPCRHWTWLRAGTGHEAKRRFLTARCQTPAELRWRGEVVRSQGNMAQTLSLRRRTSWLRRSWGGRQRQTGRARPRRGAGPPRGSAPRAAPPPVVLGPHRLGAGLIEDGADRDGDHGLGRRNPTKPASWGTPGQPGEEVHPTALPAGPEQDGCGRPLEPHVVIWPAHPAQAPGHQPA